MKKPFLARAAVLSITLAAGMAIGYLSSEASRNAAVAATGDRPAALAAKPERVQRFGAVIGLKPEKAEEYLRLHASTWPEVLARIKQCNIRNYSIYLGKLDDGNLYLFAYYEYTGDDLQADMKKMAADEHTQRWWKLTDPCQVPQKNRKAGEQWMTMREVFHME